MLRQNAHKPLPPKEELNSLIKYYWKLGFSDTKIAEYVLQHHFDCEIYGLSAKTIQRARSSLGLQSTRQRHASFDEIKPIYDIIRSQYPTMGARAMVSVLRQEYNMKVSKNLINKFLRHIEPAAVKMRRKGKFRHRKFWAAGVMEQWCLDQHDKWKKFGLWLHLGVDPYSGRLTWLKIWWCNRNPRLIISYYLQAARSLGGIPLMTTSDRGKENNGVANIQTIIRHQLDPSLRGTLQHQWCWGHNNIKPEQIWSVFRQNWSPGFENELEIGLQNGIYNPENVLENLVFRWLAIPWLQAELDRWVARFNSTPRRANKYKVLPHGIPDLIHAKPQSFGGKNFMIPITPALFDEIEYEWAPPEDPVFLLTPLLFHEQASAFYTKLGAPPVSILSFWNIYIDLLSAFQTLPGDIRFFAEVFEIANCGENDEMDVLGGLADLRKGADLVQGVTTGMDLQHGGNGVELDIDELEADLREYADFTDEESESDYSE